MRIDPSKIIPTSEDTAERWVAFHKALKSWFGKQSANAYFVKFWSQRAGAGSSADTHDLRDYMSSQGVDITTDWKGNLADFEFGIADWFGDTANLVRVVIFGTIIVGVGLWPTMLLKVPVTAIRKGRTTTALSAEDCFRVLQPNRARG